MAKINKYIKKFLIYLDDRFAFLYRKNNMSIKAIHNGSNIKIHNNYGIFCIYQYTDSDLTFMNHLEEYAKYLNLIVVFNSKPSKDILQLVKKYSKIVIERKNVGYDFVAYKTGFLYIIDNYIDVGSILFANDSTFGPFNSLEKYIDKIVSLDAKDEVLYGMISSYEHCYHVQSFWFGASSALVKNKHFRDFWRNVRSYRFKENIIHNYEIGLSRRCIAKNVRIESFFEYSLIWNAYRKNLRWENESNPKDLFIVNPSFFFWKVLLVELGFPFLKKEVVYTHQSKFWEEELCECITSSGYTKNEFLLFLKNRAILLANKGIK